MCHEIIKDFVLHHRPLGRIVAILSSCESLVSGQRLFYLDVHADNDQGGDVFLGVLSILVQTVLHLLLPSYSYS